MSPFLVVFDSFDLICVIGKIRHIAYIILLYNIRPIFANDFMAINVFFICQIAKISVCRRL